MEPNDLIVLTRNKTDKLTLFGVADDQLGVNSLISSLNFKLTKVKQIVVCKVICIPFTKET